MYGQLMLHMLKRGVLEGPFTSKPQDGSLPTLPAYMVCAAACCLLLWFRTDILVYKNGQFTKLYIH